MEIIQEPREEARSQTARELDPRWLLVKRIAHSAAFNRSDRLSTLLLFVSKMHIAGRDDEINEHLIGTEVFRRAPSFDSGADSIVRSHATRLRQRLETYFAAEGSNEPIRVEIPRGGYVPRFFPIDQASQSVPAASLAIRGSAQFEPDKQSSPKTEKQLPIPDPQFATKKQTWTIPFVAGLLLSLFVVMAIVHLRRDAVLSSERSPRVDQSILEKRFWSDLLSDRGRTLVLTGDSGLVLYETFANREISLPDYIAGTYRASDSAAPGDIHSYEKDFASRRYTSVADLSLALRLSHLPQWSDDHSKVMFARDLRPADVANSNLILIGSRQADPWVSLLDTTMNFVLTPDGAGHFYFLNRHPNSDEQSKYIPSQPGNATADSSAYALICYRPNNPGMGKMLLLSGLWMSGTEAAGNFILDHQQFSSFLATIARPDGSIPPFELLVQIRSLAGDAVSASIIARRVG
jgi:hypothetical protein